MSQKSCCVPECPVTAEDGIPLHRFPNPEINPEKFKSWIFNIGGGLTSLDNVNIYNNRRVCRRHFKDCHLYPKNRLCKLAVPVLYIPESGAIERERTDTAVPLLVAVRETEHILPSTSGGKIIQEQLTQEHCFKSSKKRKTVLKGVSLVQQKAYIVLLKQLKKCKKEKAFFKKRYLLAKRMSKNLAFSIISKKMSESSKVFCHMQFQQSGKRQRGRRFTLEEKILALSLYKPSPN